jgi:hypothetical protein
MVNIQGCLGHADEPVPNLLPVHRLLAGGGLVGEHGQAGGQVGAHLNTAGHQLGALV